MNLNNTVSNAANMKRKHVRSDIVVTALWDFNRHEQELAANELLSGELSAVIFEVGCYTVRSALRIYKLAYDADCDGELEVPADKEEVELVKEDGYDKKFHETFSSGLCLGTVDAMSFASWKDELRIYHELSAKHIENPDNEYIHICRIAQSADPEWCEYIGDIYTAKENDSIPDTDASLLVYSHYESSALGVDTWHKLDPDGSVTENRVNLFDSEQNAEL